MTLGQTNQKTVLELDLAAYSDVASALEEHLDVQAVKTFQDQIQSFVDEGLNQLGIRRDDVVFATAGDNALLIFDDPGVMHQFAKIVQEATVKHNRKKSVESAKRWFRMGAATGAVLVIAEERRIVGTTVARAVRLEAAAEKGELLIDTETYDALPEEIKKFYGEEEIVAGKRDERFTVRRCALVSPADRLGKIISRPKPVAEEKIMPAAAEKVPVEVVESAPVVEQTAAVSQPALISPLEEAKPPAPEKTATRKSIYAGITVAVVLVVLFVLFFNNRNAQELKQQSQQAAEKAKVDAAAELKQQQAEAERQRQQEETARQEREKAERLANARGGLMVDTLPSGAKVGLGGAELQTSPANFKNIHVGKTFLTVSMNGYEPVNREVEVKENEFLDLGIIRLVRQTGKVTVSSEPSGATVLQNGNQIGTTPLEINSVPTGKVNYGLKLNGYRIAEIEGEVAAKETLQLTAKLDRSGFEDFIGKWTTLRKSMPIEFTTTFSFDVEHPIHYTLTENSWEFQTAPDGGVFVASMASNCKYSTSSGEDAGMVSSGSYIYPGTGLIVQKSHSNGKAHTTVEHESRSFSAQYIPNNNVILVNQHTHTVIEKNDSFPNGSENDHDNQLAFALDSTRTKLVTFSIVDAKTILLVPELKENPACITSTDQITEDRINQVIQLDYKPEKDSGHTSSGQPIYYIKIK